MQLEDRDLSNTALKWAFALKMPPHAKLVLLALADRANNDGVCFPSLADVAGRTGLTRDRIVFLTGRLEAVGLLVVERGGPRTSNRYFLDTTVELDEPLRLPPQGRRGKRDQQKFGQTAAVVHGGNVQPQRLVTSHASGWSRHATNPQEPSINPQGKPEPSFNHDTNVLTDIRHTAPRRTANEMKADSKDVEIPASLQTGTSMKGGIPSSASLRTPVPASAIGPRTPPAAWCAAWPEPKLLNFARSRGVNPRVIEEAIIHRWGRPRGSQDQRAMWTEVWYPICVAAENDYYDDMTDISHQAAADLDDFVRSEQEASAQ